MQGFDDNDEGDDYIDDKVWQMSTRGPISTTGDLKTYPKGDPRYCIYARVSTKEQNTDLQLDACHELVAQGIIPGDEDGERLQHPSRHGYVVRELHEKRSGRTGSQEELLALIRHAAKHRCILVMLDSSRLGRDEYQKMKAKEALRLHHVSLLYCDKQSTGLVGKIKEVIDEEEVKRTRLKVTAGLRARRKRRIRSIKEANHVRNINATQVLRASLAAAEKKSEVVFKYQGQILQMREKGLSGKEIYEWLRRRDGTLAPGKTSVYAVLRRGPRKRFGAMTQLEKRAFKDKFEKRVAELDTSMQETRKKVREERLVEVGRCVLNGKLELSRSQTVKVDDPEVVEAVEMYKKWCERVFRGIVADEYGETSDDFNVMVSRIYRLGDVCVQDMELAASLLAASDEELQYVKQKLLK